jgi:hypothetical protein
MLIESPDKLIVNGRKLSWIDGTTFFAFKTPQGKTHIAITSGSGTEFLLQINQVDLTDYIKKNMPELAVYLDHESLANVLHQLKPEMIKDKMNREEFEFSGRLWNGNGRNYISFWNNKKSVDKSLLDKFMGYAKVNYQNTVFEFPNNQGDYKPYDEIVDKPTTSSQKSAEDKFMSQIHTLPPGAKKWAMRGMSMREALFSESPDNIYPFEGDPSEELTFESNEVTSVFSIFKDTVTNKIRMIVAFCKNGEAYKITTGDKDLDAEIDVNKMVEDNRGFAMIHSNLLAPIARRISDFGDTYEMRDFARLSGRTFLVEGKTFISVWNEIRFLVREKRQIDILIEKLGATKEKVLFETVDFPGEYKSYSEIYGSVEKKKSALSSEQIKDLMKKQHLDPRAKKILRTLASSDKHLDSLSRAANGMNITVAQLKNMMTAGD